MDPEEPSPSLRRPLAWVDRSLRGRSLTARRAAGIIAGASAVLTVTGGLAVRIFDAREFDNLGDSFWWALQTITTVGYGDIVPEQTGGRLIGAVLMLNGIALVAVITAAVTATLIEQARRRQAGSEEQVLAKLEQIEARLAERESGPRRGAPS